MNLNDFYTVYNATTNVVKQDRPKTDNLSLGDITVNGDISICKTSKYYERGYIPTCNAYRYFDPNSKLTDNIYKLADSDFIKQP